MRSSSRRSCRPGGEDASASVEFALVLPLVLVIGLALLQVGLLAKDQLVVVEAARAGAREATVTVDDAVVREAVIKASVGLAVERLSVSVSREGGVGTPVEVTVRYEDALRLPLVGWLFPSSTTLSDVAVMRQETG
jgi:TadE-like protein